MSPDFSYNFYTTTTDAWDAMYQAIQAARESVYWEVYTLLDDSAGRRFIDLLSLKAQSGVEVKLIFDSFGSFSLSRATQWQLKIAGVDLVWYNHLRPAFDIRDWWTRIWRRNHRKVLVIDKTTAFVGGVNVESQATEWDDVHLKISGSITQHFLHGFAKNYLLSGGPRRAVAHLLTKDKTESGKKVWKDRFQFIMHSPLLASRGLRLRRWYDQAFEFAKERITLLTPYYRPDPRFLQLVAKAKRRGVAVDVLLPLRTDSRLMRYLSEAYYAISERAGVKLHFLPRMNHGKVLSIDNHMGVVGSINFTPRSFFLNEESGIIFKENTMVKDLNGILNQWKQKALPFSEVDFHKRSRGRKVLNRLATYLQDYV